MHRAKLATDSATNKIRCSNGSLCNLIAGLGLAAIGMRYKIACVFCPKALHLLSKLKSLPRGFATEDLHDFGFI